MAARVPANDEWATLGQRQHAQTRAAAVIHRRAFLPPVLVFVLCLGHKLEGDAVDAGHVATQADVVSRLQKLP